MSKSMKRSVLSWVLACAAIATSACSAHVGQADPSVVGPALVATQPEIAQSGGGSAWKSVAYAFPGASVLYDITSGPDGNIWFTDFYGASIGRIDMSGKVKRFPTPTTGSEPYAITAGPDGNLWFTEQGPANQVGRITTAGVITEFAVTINGTSYHPGNGIVTGPDHNLWFTTKSSNAIIRMTTAGVMTSFTNPNNCAGSRITVGSDGDLWYTLNCFAVERLTTAGVFTQYALPGEQAADIASASDDDLYFTEAGDHNVGKITTGGVVTLFTSPQYVFSRGIARVGNQVWFVDEGSGPNEFGRLNIPSDTFAKPLTPKPAPLKPCCAEFLTAGSDGNVYFTMDNAHVGVYVAMAMKLAPRSATLSVNGTQMFTVSEKKYGGTWTASTSDSGIATVAPGQSSDEFVVTAHATGSCKITIKDDTGNSAVAKITVT